MAEYPMLIKQLLNTLAIYQMLGRSGMRLMNMDQRQNIETALGISMVLADSPVEPGQGENLHLACTLTLPHVRGALPTC